MIHTITLITSDDNNDFLFMSIIPRKNEKITFSNVTYKINDVIYDYVGYNDVDIKLMVEKIDE